MSQSEVNEMRAEALHHMGECEPTDCEYCEEEEKKNGPKD